MIRLYAIELAQIARRLAPRTIGAVIEHTFSDSLVERRPVYRLPRCPSCRPEQPQRLAWDARFTAPTLKVAAE